MAEITKLVPIPEPWSPAQATERIRRIAQEDSFCLTLTGHAEDQMKERGITAIDVMYVLKNGFVYDPPVQATRAGFYRYSMINPTPNSNRREVRVVLIPSIQAAQAKVATVMWADEPVVGG
ncbi:MAG TPA: DUF4258 domain-containing protein [Rhizomicrobium sp.]|nr:DUF4258 domain-containing protein [Rhizomicrobium sp.]